MADVSKIRVDGVDYDVKDDTARTKLDGKIDSNVLILSQTSLTDAALNQAESTVKHYAISGSSYAETDLPSEDGYKYGNATVFKRYGFITVILWGDRTVKKLAIRYYNGTQKTWTNWFTIPMTEVTST